MESNKRVWPGIYVHVVDEVMEFEDWFGNLGGNGRYIGNQLQILGGPNVSPGETVGYADGVFVVIR